MSTSRARSAGMTEAGETPWPAAAVLAPEGGDFNDDLATAAGPVVRLALFLGPALSPLSG